MAYCMGEALSFILEFAGKTFHLSSKSSSTQLNWWLAGSKGFRPVFTFRMRVAEGAVKSGLMEAMHSRKPVSKEERVAASSKLASSRICKEGSCKGEEVEMEKCSLGLWKQCIHGNQSQKRRVAASSKVASRRICREGVEIKGVKTEKWSQD